MTAPVRRHALVLPLACLLTLLLGGCVSLPTEGPVVDSDIIDADDSPRASDIDARPPAAGASRSEVVSGFLDAMTAWPVQINVAKQYLTEEAASSWNPERETVVYSDVPLAPREAGNTVRVRLGAADTLDGAGAWRGAVSGDDLDLGFRLTVEGGEFRIADPADALVVPASWFQQRYRQVSLFYFDPIAQILVPEPVFVPQGDQLATSLVSGLLEGPPPRARGVVQSFVPRGLSVGLSVPVDDRGVADIDLVGDAPRLTAEESELMLAQLAWTLRQVPEITALRVSVGGESLPIPGGASQFPVDGGQAFDPAGDKATGLLFGLTRGRLVWGSSGNLVTATGPFGDEGAGLEAVAARPDAAVAAGVDAGGRRVRRRAGPRHPGHHPRRPDRPERRQVRPSVVGLRRPALGARPSARRGTGAARRGRPGPRGRRPGDQRTRRPGPGRLPRRHPARRRRPDHGRRRGRRCPGRHQRARPGLPGAGTVPHPGAPRAP